MSAIILITFALFIVGDSMLLYALLLQAKWGDERMVELIHGQEALWKSGGTIS